MSVVDERNHPRVFVCDNCNKPIKVTDKHYQVPEDWYFVAVGYADHSIAIEDAQIVLHFCSRECFAKQVLHGFSFPAEAR